MYACIQTVYVALYLNILTVASLQYINEVNYKWLRAPYGIDSRIDGLTGDRYTQRALSNHEVNQLK